eukprot:1161289-Pelagomonas_calceolata.AAC.2
MDMRKDWKRCDPASVGDGDAPSMSRGVQTCAYLWMDGRAPSAGKMKHKNKYARREFVLHEYVRALSALENVRSLLAGAPFAPTALFVTAGLKSACWCTTRIIDYVVAAILKPVCWCASRLLTCAAGLLNRKCEPPPILGLTVKQAMHPYGAPYWGKRHICQTPLRRRSTSNLYRRATFTDEQPLPTSCLVKV